MILLFSAGVVVGWLLCLFVEARLDARQVVERDELDTEAAALRARLDVAELRLARGTHAEQQEAWLRKIANAAGLKGFAPYVHIGPCGCDKERDPWDRCDDCLKRGWAPVDLPALVDAVHQLRADPPSFIPINPVTDAEIEAALAPYDAARTSSPILSDAEDTRRWRALWGTARIRMLGGSHDANGRWNVICLELHRDPVRRPTDDSHSRRVLLEYVDQVVDPIWEPRG